MNFDTHVNGNVTIKTGAHEGTYTEAELASLLTSLRSGQDWLDGDAAAVVIIHGEPVWAGGGYSFVRFDEDLYAIDMDADPADPIVYQLSGV